MNYRRSLREKPSSSSPKTEMIDTFSKLLSTRSGTEVTIQSILDEDFDLEVEDECSYDSLLYAVQCRLNNEGSSLDAQAVVRDMIGANSNTEAKETVDNMCGDMTEEMSENEFMHYNAQYRQDLKEYFDGGTYMNEDRETLLQYGENQPPSKVLKDDLSFINDLYGDVAQSKGMEFPEDMTNFENCEIGAAMCCWIQDRQANDNNGGCATPYDDNCIDEDPADNTDICYVDMERDTGSSHVPGGFAVFEGGSEGDTHCHGFAWDEAEEDAIARYRGNNLFYVSMYDHLYSRGYVRAVPGSPMCGCVEQMAVVSRSDCTQLDVQESFVFKYRIDGSGSGSGSASCQDTPGFIDTYGDGCDWYEQNDPGCLVWGDICCTGGFGSPNDECCFCGGGSTVNANSEAGNLSVESGNLNIEFNSCQGANGNNNDLAAYFERLVDEGKQSANNLEALEETIVGVDNCDDAIDDFLEGRRRRRA